MSEKLEELIEQNNDLLKKKLIFDLFRMNVPQQQIRKSVGCDMAFITKFLKPLKNINRGDSE